MANEKLNWVPYLIRRKRRAYSVFLFLLAAKTLSFKQRSGLKKLFKTFKKTASIGTVYDSYLISHSSKQRLGGSLADVLNMASQGSIKHLMKKRRPFRVLSYNIHQGLTVAKRKLSLGTLKEAIKSLKVDLVLLQEVAGVKATSKSRPPIPSDETPFQLEALADEIWPYYAYGRNAVFSGGFHGNAVLSAFPIENFKNIDISITKRGLVRRGILHTQIDLVGTGKKVHILATHFGLLQAERQRQLKRLVEYIKTHVPPRSPVILGGDFNDWREKISGRLSKTLGFREAFLESHSRHARTFPSGFPLLKLDRIYFRYLQLHKVEKVKGRPWLFLSDHLPLVAEFDLEPD